MIAYAARTGTRRNLDALRAAGWRLTVSARGVLRTEGFPDALDNGAWTAFQRGEPFDVAAFEKAVALLAPGADWIVLPDIVMGGAASLTMSIAWLRRLRRRAALRGARFMLVVQNGMESGSMLGRIKRVIGPSVGIFVGGDTPWKEATVRFWARLAHSRGATCHVGRVNTARRIQLCEDGGADSFAAELKLPGEGEAGMKLIRRSMAQLLRERGVDDQQVEMQLGHRRIDSVCELYAPFSPNYLQAALAAIEAVIDDIEGRCPGAFHRTNTGGPSNIIPIGASISA